MITKFKKMFLKLEYITEVFSSAMPVYKQLSYKMSYIIHPSSHPSIHRQPLSCVQGGR